jgi:hypothetical protein
MAGPNKKNAEHREEENKKALVAELVALFNPNSESPNREESSDELERALQGPDQYMAENQLRVLQLLNVQVGALKNLLPKKTDTFENLSKEDKKKYSDILSNINVLYKCVLEKRNIKQKAAAKGRNILTATAHAVGLKADLSEQKKKAHTALLRAAEQFKSPPADKTSSKHESDYCLPLKMAIINYENYLAEAIEKRTPAIKADPKAAKRPPPPAPPAGTEAQTQAATRPPPPAPPAEVKPVPAPRKPRAVTPQAKAKAAGAGAEPRTKPVPAQRKPQAAGAQAQGSAPSKRPVPAPRSRKPGKP